MKYTKDSDKAKEKLSRNYPAIAAEWDYERNEKGPDDYHVGSAKRVSWICPKGHHYETSIYNRTRRNFKCTICSGKKTVAGVNDLGTLRTDLMDEWDFDKNLFVFPTEVTVRSNKKVWWKCRDCGHSWQAAISNRTRGSRCPKCGHLKEKTKFLTVS